MPPLFGPPFPPSSVIVITVFGAASCSESQCPGMRTRIAKTARCASSEMTAIRWKPSGSPMRSRSTSATSTSNLSRGLGHDRDLRNAGVFQLIDHLHQVLQLHGAVTLQIDLLVGDRLQALS